MKTRTPGGHPEVLPGQYGIIRLTKIFPRYIRGVLRESRDASVMSFLIGQNISGRNLDNLIRGPGSPGRTLSWSSIKLIINASGVAAKKAEKKC